MRNLKVPWVIIVFPRSMHHGAVLVWFLAKLFMLFEAVLLQTLSLVHCTLVYTYINDSCPTIASSRGAIVDRHGLQMVSYIVLVANLRDPVDSIDSDFHSREPNRELISGFWTATSHIYLMLSTSNFCRHFTTFCSSTTQLIELDPSLE
jgi:hypothetical protein